MSNEDNSLAPYRRFRISTVRMMLIAVVVLAGLSLLISRIATQGVLLGGFAAILGFWIIAVRLEKLTVVNPQKVRFAALTMSTLRYLLYGVVLYKAFTLDQETYHGLLGAVIGVFGVRYTLVFVGISGKGMPEITDDEQHASDPDVTAEKIQEELDGSSKTDG